MPSQTCVLHPVRLRSVQAGWGLNIHYQFKVLWGLAKYAVLLTEFSSFRKASYDLF